MYSSSDITSAGMGSVFVFIGEFCRCAIDLAMEPSFIFSVVVVVVVVV